MMEPAAMVNSVRAVHQKEEEKDIRTAAVTTEEIPVILEKTEILGTQGIPEIPEIHVVTTEESQDRQSRLR